MKRVSPSSSPNLKDVPLQPVISASKLPTKPISTSQKVAPTCKPTAQHNGQSDDDDDDQDNDNVGTHQNVPESYSNKKNSQTSNNSDTNKSAPPAPPPSSSSSNVLNSRYRFFFVSMTHSVCVMHVPYFLQANK